MLPAISLLRPTDIQHIPYIHKLYRPIDGGKSINCDRYYKSAREDVFRVVVALAVMHIYLYLYKQEIYGVCVCSPARMTLRKALGH